MEQPFKILIEKHPDTYEDALADGRSAIAFHIETFGPDASSKATQALSLASSQRRVRVRATP